MNFPTRFIIAIWTDCGRLTAVAKTISVLYYASVAMVTEKHEQTVHESGHKEGEPLSLDLVYTEVKDRLEVQLHQIDALDTKSGTLLFAGAFILSIGAAAQATMLGHTPEVSVLLLFSVPILCYFMATFFCLRGWVNRPYYRDPEPKPLHEYYLFREVEFTKRRIVTHFVSTYESNSIVMRRKVRDLRWAVIFSLLEIVTLVFILLTRPWFQ